MLFFDTYALIEIISGNKNYSKFMKEKPITTKLNLMELYYYLLREFNEEKANYYYNFYLPVVVSISDDSIKKAMKFKLNIKKIGKKLSYVDSMGYILSLDKKMNFLTGDKEFRDLPNVKFVV